MKDFIIEFMIVFTNSFLGQIGNTM